MNVRSAAARLSAPMSARVEPQVQAGADLTARRAREIRRRRLIVLGLQLLVAVVWLGTWELTTRLGWVDKFFFAQPSEIALKLLTWVTQGTELGPLWDQVLTTMEETVGGVIVRSPPRGLFGVEPRRV